VLTSYEEATARLLQNPSAPTPLYATTDLDAYINVARGQLSGEAECIVAVGTLALTQGVQVYPFSSIVYPSASSVSGIQGPLNIRQAWRVVGSGQTWITPRPWPWFSLYELSNPAPAQGPPVVWSQYGQGVNGTIYVSPVPDQSYTLNVDVPSYPITLVDDTTVEAIPYAFTDAVPFFAAYYALLAAQSTARQADADRMLQRYTQFVQRARSMANPSVLPFIYSQTGNPVSANQLGTQGQSASAGP
jgi:hypothetical protein